MASLTIRVSKDQLEFVKEQVAEQGYRSPSAYVDELVRAERKRRAVEKLVKMVQKADASGPPKSMTKRDWQELRLKVTGEIARRKRRKMRR